MLADDDHELDKVGWNKPVFGLNLVFDCLSLLPHVPTYSRRALERSEQSDQQKEATG